MNRKMRQIITSIKEKSCMSYAKIATLGGFCDIDLIVIKATSHDDSPLPDRYIQELLKIFSISPSSFRAFSVSFTRRFRKTQAWRVALKCLLLLHHLLLSSPSDTNKMIRQKLLCSRMNGLMNIYPCYFKDCSSSSMDSNEYTKFIRSYACFLDESMDCLAIEREMNIEIFIQELTKLQSLIDRVIGCKPNKGISKSMLIGSAMKYVINDSVSCYATFKNEFVGVLDNLIQLPYQSCQAAFDVYKKAALQADQLCEFYDWCQDMGFCGTCELPFVDRIPQIQIEALGNFLNGMYQLKTDSSSSESSSSESDLATSRSRSFSAPTSVEDENMALVKLDDLCKEDGFVEEVVEMEDLIQFDDDDLGWEELLEASLRPHLVVSECMSTSDFGDVDNNSTNGWEAQLYKHHSNTFDLNSSQHHGHREIVSQDFSSGPMYPWGL